MSVQKSKQVEQVSLEFIVENAYESFAKTILSTRTKVLLIGGYIDQTSAVKAYLSKKRSSIDRRKKLNQEDESYVSMVEQYACDADEYVNWVRSEDGLPVWRDALVSYCTAFENCLKAIAVAFLLADRQFDTGLRSQVIIPSEELTRARRAISKQWSDADGDMPKVRNFFESGIRLKNAAKRYYGLANDVSEADWEICSAAFQVRNAIVHNLGFMPHSVSLGTLDLHASWSVELDQKSIAVVGKSLSKILEPFDPLSLCL